MHVTDEDISDRLEQAHYDHAYEICKIFLSYYYNKADKNADNIDIELLKRTIKSKASLGDINITFDETIWSPDRPEDHKRLMLFEIRLPLPPHRMEIISFYLYVDNSPSQRPIMVELR